MAVLCRAEIEKNLVRIPGWGFTGSALSRERRFPSFMEAIGFVNRVARAAEEIDHHPDITIHYRQITLTLWTHSEGGVTDKDLELAARINQL